MTSARDSGGCSELAPARVSRLLEEYRGVVLEHPLLNRALGDVERGIAPGMPRQIVLLLGPTGVGKTTLIKAMERRRSPGGQVVRATCVPVAGRQGYDFGRTHWRLIAQALGDPFRDEHLSPDAIGARLRSGVVRRDGAATAAEYRLGVLDLLREHGARAVVLDEAQHMTRVPNARSQADQLDVIKDCVDRTLIPHVLVGTYELLVMVAGDQLGRRSLVVPFGPYRPSDESDRLAFQKIFGQFVNKLPLAERERSWAELRTHLPEVCVGCAGCVGILKDWLCRALQLALEARAEFVDWPLMERCRMPDRALFAVANEIRTFRDSKEPSRGEIERALEFDGHVQARGAISPSSGGEEELPGAASVGGLPETGQAFAGP